MVLRTFCVEGETKLGIGILKIKAKDRADALKRARKGKGKAHGKEGNGLIRIWGNSCWLDRS